jgi:hypothetical protein
LEFELFVIVRKGNYGYARIPILGRSPPPFISQTESRRTRH